MIGGRLEAFVPVPADVVISATNSGGGPTSVAITAGTYTITALVALVVAQLNSLRPPSSGAWSGSLSVGRDGTGLVTLNCTGTWSIAWTSTDLRDLLGFTVNLAGVTAAQTGTRNVAGVWLPKCELAGVESHPYAAPEVSDARSSETPDGDVTTLVGTYKLVHKGLRWPMVDNARTWEAFATTPGSSWQQWVRDTQLHRGHPWFEVGSKFLVYYDVNGTDTVLGGELNAGAGPSSGWKAAPPIATIDPQRSLADYLGLWALRIDRVVASG